MRDVETFEYTGDREAARAWGNEMLARSTGRSPDVDLFAWHGPAGELCLTAGSQGEGRIKPGEVIACLVRGVSGSGGPIDAITFVKAGAWVVGHNLAGYLPESDVTAFAEWDDARDCLLEEGSRYTEENDESEWAALVMETDDGPREVGPDSEPHMTEDWKAALVETPLEPGKGWGALIADTSGRQISFWLRWDKFAVPDEVLEG